MCQMHSNILSVLCIHYELLLITMGESSVLALHKAIEELITTYHELNGSHVAELTEVPSPIEFMQYVRRGRPCVIRGAASEWPATNWTVEYLENKMKGSYIQVAITPLGCVNSFLIGHFSRCLGEFFLRSAGLTVSRNADAIVLNPNDEASYFVKPLQVNELFSDFIRYVRDQELLSPKPTGNVKYSQAREWNETILRYTHPLLY